MKKSRLFLFVAIILTVVISCSSGIFVSTCLSKIRENSNKAVMEVITAVRESYPKITDTEIAEILNNKGDTKNSEKAMSSYGITSEKWSAIENDSESKFLFVFVPVFCVLEFLTILVIFLIYNRMRKKEEEKLADYISKLNSGIYSLDLQENTENDNSLLKNEVYKTTVMLRQQRENSLQDKIKLKNSLSDISHQLKTPLTSIIVMVDSIIEDENMPSEIRRDFLKDIRRSTGNISFLVQSILTLSKFDANSIMLKSERERAKEILTEAVQNTAVLAEVKGIDVVVKEEDAELFCDKKWVTQAVTNIVKNCIEHTKCGGIVTLSAKENKLYTKITIEDNGEGIDKEDLPHIFERFYKGKNSSEESVGIGLALAKTIIESNGGLISATSEARIGSSFVIKFFKP